MYLVERVRFGQREHTEPARNLSTRLPMQCHRRFVGRGDLQEPRAAAIADSDRVASERAHAAPAAYAAAFCTWKLVTACPATRVIAW